MVRSVDHLKVAFLAAYAHCLSWTDLQRQFYMLLNWDRRCGWKLAISLSYSRLTPGQSVIALALWRQALCNVATTASIFEQLVWLDGGTRGEIPCLPHPRRTPKHQDIEALAGRAFNFAVHSYPLRCKCKISKKANDKPNKQRSKHTSKIIKKASKQTSKTKKKL